MDFLRSRGLRRALAWSPFVGCVAVVAAYAAINAYGEWKFDKIDEALVARGYARTEAEAIGPMPPDKENLLKHPAVLAELERKNHPEDPMVVPHRTSSLDWFERIPETASLVEEIEKRFDEKTSKGHSWLDATDFVGARGIAEAERILGLVAPHAAQRTAMLEAVATARPACAKYEIGGESSELLHSFVDFIHFFDHHGIVCLATGRKAEASEDLIAALQIARSMQTPAISEEHAEIAILLMEDSLRSALMDPPAGSWAEDDLAAFERELAGLSNERLIQEYQRMNATWVIETWDKIQSGRLRRPPRIDWERWRGAWKWTGDEVEEHLKALWLGVRPHGLGDLEAAAKLEKLVSIIEEIGDPPDWQRFSSKLAVPEDYLMDNAEFRYERSHSLAWEIVVGLVVGESPDYPEVATFDRAYTEAWAPEGYVWIAMARWAIALERHRLRHGSFPTSLDGLDSDLTTALPADPLSRKPFQYRVGTDGGFELEGARPVWKPDKPFVWRREMTP